jgi:hypothetical protein
MAVLNYTTKPQKPKEHIVAVEFFFPFSLAFHGSAITAPLFFSFIPCAAAARIRNSAISEILHRPVNLKKTPKNETHKQKIRGYVYVNNNASNTRHQQQQQKTQLFAYV